MSLLTELARRVVSHPHTATFAKRAVAVQYGEGEKIEVPTWGVVVIYVTILLASVAVSLVSTLCCLYCRLPLGCIAISKMRFKLTTPC